MKSLALIVCLIFQLKAMSGIISQADCKTMDIRDTNPKIRNNPTLRAHFSKPRNQDSIGWCYAFAAADLLSEFYGFPVSSLHAAIIYNKIFFLDPRLKKIASDRRKVDHPLYREVYEAGTVSDSIPIVSSSKWICSEKGLPFDIDRPRKINQMILDLEYLKSSYSQVQSQELDVCKEFTKIISPYTVAALDAKAIAENLLLQNMNLTLDQFADKACKEKFTLFRQPKVKQINKLDSKGQPNKNLMKEMNQLLSKGKLIDFAYNPSVFTNLSGVHSNLIMGRRWNKNRCEYYIRNSWGEMCSPYNPNIECNKKEGSFWVSDEEMYRALYYLAYLE